MCVDAIYDPKYLPDEFYGYKVIPHYMETPNRRETSSQAEQFQYKIGENVDTREHGLCVFTNSYSAEDWYKLGVGREFDEEHIYRVKVRREDVIAMDKEAVRVKRLCLEPERLNPSELPELPLLPMKKF